MENGMNQEPLNMYEFMVDKSLHFCPEVLFFLLTATMNLLVHFCRIDLCLK